VGALAVAGYAGLATFLILKLIGLVTPLRVQAEQERVGLDMSQHGEMLSPKT
jgi:Amt family ammonium transporter